MSAQKDVFKAGKKAAEERDIARGEREKQNKTEFEMMKNSNMIKVKEVQEACAAAEKTEQLNRSALAAKIENQRKQFTDKEGKRV